MTQILFDDIGSYPLPRGILLEGLSPDAYATLVRECMEQKLAAGVEVPTYPQFRDMIDMFMKPIESPDESESPYIVRKEAAEIEELNALEPLAISRAGLFALGYASQAQSSSTSPPSGPLHTPISSSTWQPP